MRYAARALDSLLFQEPPRNARDSVPGRPADPLASLLKYHEKNFRLALRARTVGRSSEIQSPEPQRSEDGGRAHHPKTEIEVAIALPYGSAYVGHGLIPRNAVVVAPPERLLTHDHQPCPSVPVGVGRIDQLRGGHARVAGEEAKPQRHRVLVGQRRLAQITLQSLPEKTSLLNR